MNIRKISLVVLMLFSVSSWAQIIVLENIGPRDGKTKFEFIVSEDYFNVGLLDGTEYISISDSDFSIIISQIQELEIPVLAMGDQGKADFNSWSITIIKGAEFKEYYLANQESVDQFVAAISKRLNESRLKGALLQISR